MHFTVLWSPLFLLLNTRRMSVTLCGVNDGQPMGQSLSVFHGTQKKLFLEGRERKDAEEAGPFFSLFVRDASAPGQ